MKRLNKFSRLYKNTFVRYPEIQRHSILGVCIAWSVVGRADYARAHRSAVPRRYSYWVVYLLLHSEHLSNVQTYPDIYEIDTRPSTRVSSCFMVDRVASPDSNVPLFNRKFRDFASLYLGKYCTFVCATLFRTIKQIELYPPKFRYFRIAFSRELVGPDSF